MTKIERDEAVRLVEKIIEEHGPRWLAEVIAPILWNALAAHVGFGSLDWDEIDDGTRETITASVEEDIKVAAESRRRNGWTEADIAAEEAGS